MKEQPDQCDSDLLSNWRVSLLLWGGPAILVVVGLLLPAGVADALWMVCYAVMGIGCVANARSCDRVHCHFTAPWFLLIALLIAVNLVGLLPVDRLTAPVLAVAGLIGAGVIWLLTEQLWGRYWRRRAGKSKEGI